MWWSEPKSVKSHIIEVEKFKTPPETPEAIASVTSLQGHSGFQWLLKKLRYQSARLRAELVDARHEDLRAVDFLQSGIHWCDWLQSQLDFANEKYLSMRDSTPSEEDFFKQIATQIDFVGRIDDANN